MYGIAPGRKTSRIDHHIWFTENGTDRVGRLTAGGAFAEYYLGAQRAPTGIGAYGTRIWFAESDRIGMFETAFSSAGTLTEYLPITPPDATLNALTMVSGAAWVADSSGRTLRRFTTHGASEERTIPTSDPEVSAVVRGRDGALWFTEAGPNKIGRMTISSGAFTEYPIPAPDSGPAGITAGPDGNVWFTERAAGKIARITGGSVITEFPIGGGPVGIIEGPDGNLWVTQSSSNQIARVNDPSFVAACPTTPDPSCMPGAAGSLQMQIGSQSKLSWRWTKSLAVSPQDFGDPVNEGTGYKLCLYEDAGDARLQDAPPHVWRRQLRHERQAMLATNRAGVDFPRKRGHRRPHPRT